MSMPSPEFPFFDDVTVNRPRFAERAPSAQDWNQLISEIKAHQSVLAAGDYVTAVKTVGNGVWDDTNALKEAIASGKNVELEPGKTYLLRDTLTLQAGQILDGRGATLKIMDQFTTTTVETIAHAVKSDLVVADVSGFQVGDYVGILQSAALNVVQTRQIIRIDPVTKTLYFNAVMNTNNGTTIAQAGTTYVYRAFYAIDTGNTGNCVIRNVNIDGNTAGQAHGYWTHTGGIRTAGANNLVENCRLYNILGEGIIMFGSESCVRRCRLEDLAGNGVHFSAGDHCTVENSYFRNCSKNTMIQHNHGGISWSALCDKMTIQNNWFEDCLRGCDGISGNDESQCKIINNYFLNNDNGSIRINATVAGTGSWRCLISGNWSSEDVGANLTVVGNNFTTEVVQNIVVTGNHWIQSANTATVSFNTTRGIVLSDNLCVCTNASHTGANVRFDGCIQAICSGNLVRGGSIGIICETTGSTTCKQCTIIGNSVSEQRTVGIRHNTSLDTEINISNNTVWNDPTTTSNGYTGIICNSGSLVQGNVVRVDSNGGVITTTKCITASSAIATTIGAVIQLNQIRGNPSIGIQIFGGTKNVVVQYNICTTSAGITNSGGVSGTGATITYTGTVSGGALELGTGKVSIGAGGSGYSGSITVNFIQGTNATAFGSAVLTGDAISGVNITIAGSGYTTPGTPITVVIGGNFVTGNFTLATTG